MRTMPLLRKWQAHAIRHYAGGRHGRTDIAKLMLWGLDGSCDRLLSTRARETLDLFFRSSKAPAFPHSSGRRPCLPYCLLAQTDLLATACTLDDNHKCNFQAGLSCCRNVRRPRPGRIRNRVLFATRRRRRNCCSGAQPIQASRAFTLNTPHCQTASASRRPSAVSATCRP